MTTWQLRSKENLLPTDDPAHLPLPDPEPSLAVAVKRRLPGFTLDIRFSVPAGLTVLFGPSGSGKSMTLQSLAGLCPLDTARIVLGRVVLHDSSAGIFLPPQERHVGYVPQNYALFPHLSVVQNIAFGLKTRGRAASQRIAELISLVRLDGLELLRPSQLSGGQQQRVALARALAADPQLLLLDEPFGSLDAAVREALRDELLDFHQRVGVPIVLVTHDAQEARMLADTVVVVQGGRVMQEGPQDVVFRAPRTRATAALVGMRACWPGEVVALQRSETEIYDQPAAKETPQTLTPAIMATVQVADLRLRAVVPPGLTLFQGQRVNVGIRADEVRLFSDYLANELAGMQTVRGTVVRDQPRGLLHAITVRLMSGLLLEVPVMRWEHRDLNLSAGAVVTVKIPVDAVHIFDPAAEEAADYNNKV